MTEERLDGGNTGGAVRDGDTVRRAAGPWTPAVHALLTHLAAKNFPGAPRPLGFDNQGREVLTFIEGETVGSRKPWPACYNAAWHEGTLAGFFDWDFAGPATEEWDLAFAAFSWVPLHARHVVAAEGFTDFAARPRRLRRFLRAYGWTATEAEFLHVVRARVQAHADGIRSLAAEGDEVSERLLSQGVADDLDRALAELGNFPR